MSRTVSVIMTIKNDGSGCAATLDSLLKQTLAADEIIVVDGGSTDDTLSVVRERMDRCGRIRLIDAPGSNIAQGRNIGVRAATTELIATTDAGCRAESAWLARLVAPFDEDDAVEFVAGFYHVEAHTLLETVVGLATMRGQLDPVCSETFNPSARSMACTKSLWSRAGGWPEWLCFSEDTLFDHKVRRLDAHWRFAGDAVVHWRPRRTLRAVARQFYNYGTGRGHTRIGLDDFVYGLRNILIMLVAGVGCFVSLWSLVPLMASVAYFLVWTFHAKAVRIARRTGRRSAYALCMVLMWVVMGSNHLGFVVGSWQRWRDRARYHDQLEAYLAGS